MNQIKFSHTYPKLYEQKTAILVAMTELHFPEDRNEKLMNYDTKYVDRSGQIKHFSLPQKGKLLQLVFIGNKHIPFCTLRRWTKYKELYYQSKIGQQFEIVIVNDDGKF